MQVEIGEGIRSILIVEDEGILAMMMEDLVRELGVRDVHICGDVATALELARNADIDCAVLDLSVRGGSTVDVANVLAARNVPFLFSTGSDVGAMAEQHARRPTINKPFSDDDFKLIVVDTCTLGRCARQPEFASASRVATSGATD